VQAGVDSIEHGMCLDPSYLDRMAALGIALTPTLSVISASLETARHTPPSRRNEWYVPGASAHPHLAAAAIDAGVTVLAGTDSRPHGRIVDEVRSLVAAGVSAHDAIGAASWTARSYLGFGGLQAGEPADAVIYDSDPRLDLGQLDKPSAVILRGRLAATRL
jgi:imidazolonepropionase-like amidohydrolase